VASHIADKFRLKQTGQVKGHLAHMTCLALTFATGLAVDHLARTVSARRDLPQAAIETSCEISPAQQPRSAPSASERQIPADFFVDKDHLTLNGYTIQKRRRKALLEYPDEANATSRWVDVSYVQVKKGNKVLAKFDGNVYFGLGNSTSFGFFPFLGGNSQQLFISQDIPRGGCQWIVSLTPTFKIIFDGQQYAVGREGSDITAVDLDNDGVFEITAPITDFYEFQDKLPISRIPLPLVIFKYDAETRRYLPANPLFENYVQQEVDDLPNINPLDEFDQRASILEQLLTYIYAGKEDVGWKFYEKTYKLNDKDEIRRRVKTILRNQHVYKFIYNHNSHK
jgi:hypothetical protein